MKPVELAPNQLHRFYRGGEAIARFRGVPSTDDHAPEDWVGSTATLFGASGAGLSARQLRFWELILELPHREVNAWLAEPARRIWEAR